MTKTMTGRLLLWLGLFGIIILENPVFAQVESSLLILNRGMLWQSVFNGKIGPNFNNWGRRGIGLDWPGFDETWIQEDIGGPASYMLSGGLWVGCKRTNDSVLAVEDWAMYGGTVSNEPGVKYLLTKHRKKFKNGENYWLKTNPLEGEEVIESEWEYNLNYNNVYDQRFQMPVRVRRTTHQWSGSRRDENYIIHEYVFKNISKEIRAKDSVRFVADTLVNFYVMMCYALHANSRSWNVLFPSLSPGARNTQFIFDSRFNLIAGNAGDYRDSPANESYAFAASQGPLIDGTPTGEWLAPGVVGISLVYSSPDLKGREARYNQFGWSAASNSIDLSGPFNGLGDSKTKYEALENIQKVASYAGPLDTSYMRRTRMWSLMTVGPYTILPGDSITIVVGELVDGIDYALALDKTLSVSAIGNKNNAIVTATAKKMIFTYNQKRAGRGLNHPDPPAAPKFSLDIFKDRPKYAATKILWDNSTESLPDPDDGTLDLAGYHVYRSSYLPIGPWQLIGTVQKSAAPYFDVGTGKYTFVDSAGDVGTNYYYALTAYDTGKAFWTPNPSQVFDETGSIKVPPLESSIFANRTITPFKMTLPSQQTLNEVLVVPNPFVIGKGYSQPTSRDEIMFVNIPNPCTIRIYTVRGDLVRKIDVPQGFGGIVGWDQMTGYGQFVESGIYVYHIESDAGTKLGKFAIIR
jgi:hypothetical protein